MSILSALKTFLTIHAKSSNLSPSQQIGDQMTKKKRDHLKKRWSACPSTKNVAIMAKSSVQLSGMVQMMTSLSDEGLQFLLDHFEQLQKAIQEARKHHLLEQWANELVMYNERNLLKINQYIRIQESDRRKWIHAYIDWFTYISSIQQNKKRKDLPYIQKEQTVSHVKNHQQNLRWMTEKLFQQLVRTLIRSNGLALFWFDNRKCLWLKRSPCEEYSADFQLSLYGLDLALLKEPVLDIGCGQYAWLVETLRDHGINAYGLERFPSKKNYIISIDWFDYSFNECTWGTILSNMAFSNHFWHHHLRKDGQPHAYAKKYMEILYSLKPGGVFIYTPGLPFMEKILRETEDFIVRKKPIPSPFLKMANKASHLYVSFIERKQK